MSLSDRDKKILIAIVPMLVIAAYWFLLLAPKREEASNAAAALTKQEERRDAAKAAVTQASQAQTDFASDYAEIVRLGKAIPAHMDMPSLLVQLDAAAEGTGIRFTKIAAGEREATAAATAAPPADGKAQSAPGQAAESAKGAASTSDQRNAAAEQSGVSAADAQTSTAAREGGLPVGGGSTDAGAQGGTSGSAPAGLETVPLELEFEGDFFKLADFFHAVKRFVDVAESNVVVNGRLVTIESVDFVSDSTLFPKMRAELTATVYLAPKAEGTTAGATPQGPAATTPAAAGGEAAPTDGAPTPPAPTAAAIP